MLTTEVIFTKPPKHLLITTFLILVLAPWSLAYCQPKDPMDKKCEQHANKNTVECLQWRGLKILSNSKGDQAEIKKAITLFKQAREIAPFKISILSNLAGCYMKMRDYKTTLSYMNKILKIDPDRMDVKFFICLLKERLKHPPEECWTCYRYVASWYQIRGRTKDVNYVYARLMLGGPDTDKIKNEYLAGLKPGSEQFEMWKILLKDFDRNKYIKNWFP